MSVFRKDRDPVGTAQLETPPRQTSPAAPEPARYAPVATTSAPAQPPEPQREGAAIVDKRSEITGTLHSKGNVLIEGNFQGEIEAKETVWVEQGAQTKGQLCANDVVISGAFDGEINCQHRLQVTSSASIQGEIKTPVLVIEEGSTVNCRFKMTRAGR
jgi:cytoskeletal protein CcmA (bactofilin family)